MTISHTKTGYPPPLHCAINCSDFGCDKDLAWAEIPPKSTAVADASSTAILYFAFMKIFSVFL
ncbi:hypothetical protein [[Scytonema hofmanni] UTEX B 1581]|uniref:hypothetical protein n=1 Tax=[Scytonema hofmanni] UTEX B 1581 TaxID=379535 RepID=UPI0011823D96|nr:hypothetical protein [[Scytonema hofmanni] UTEX B 1581]